jgi:hypothetical protein
MSSPGATPTGGARGFLRARAQRAINAQAGVLSIALPSAARIIPPNAADPGEQAGALGEEFQTKTVMAATAVAGGIAAATEIAAEGGGLASEGPLGRSATTAAEKFYIDNGVRRTIAVREAGGAKEISATIFEPGKAPLTRTLQLDQLFSPKSAIQLDSRFLRIQPPIHTPIEVQPLGLPGQLPTVPVDQVLLVP